MHLHLNDRFIFFQIFICSLIFTTFWVDQTKPQNRIQLSFILLLSNITFKFSVSNTVPKVSYLTYLVSNLFQIFICSLIFTTFWIPQTIPQNRIQLSFILLLSNITFKFSVSNTVPKVSYLTYLVSIVIGDGDLLEVKRGLFFSTPLIPPSARRANFFAR